MWATEASYRLRRGRRRKKGIGALLALLTLIDMAFGQCPWPREVAELNGSCLCAFDEKSELSVQCSSVNFSLLMTVLHQRAGSVPFDTLYVNNSNVNVLNDRTFYGLTISNIQFSHCGIYNISTRAFEGLEDTLDHLNLQNNKLTQVPSEAISGLRTLTQLDLSGNRLTRIPSMAFKGPPLATLKLADNDLRLVEGSFGGLERTLKNLNLKGVGLTEVPPSIRPLALLAFLDLAQNEIRSLYRGTFSTLESLTALNLERNSLQRLEHKAFFGVNDTLSSLSLLNNMITAFPKIAINSLTELRVLDIGFNLMTRIPPDAFIKVKSLTLLALDGNPLPTIPVAAFNHLNNTLRGLSVGGRFLECNCSISWITEWIRDFDLQVTSRERSPQFCGGPPELKEMSFYQLNRDDLNCPRPEPPTVPNKTPRPVLGDVVVPPTRRPEPISTTTIRRRIPPKRPRTTTSTTQRSTTTASSTTQTVPKITSRRPDPLKRRPSSRLGTAIKNQEPKETGTAPIGRPTVKVTPQQRPRPVPIPPAPASSISINRPPLIRRNEIARRTDNMFGPQTAQGPFVDEVIVQDAYRKDNSVIIQWDSEVSNILGFRVVYRLFGDKHFKLGPPLASSEREFKIRNVPTQECVVVCVVSLEDVNVTPENVQYEQCREIRTETSAATHMDTIIIAASSAICGTVIIAVIVFICCNRRRGGRNEKNGLPAVLSPISPPLASLGALGSTHKADWDTISMYSQRSIPRARMYHLDKGSVNNGFIPDDTRSHISHMSQKSHRSRSLADGQSQRSYSAMSTARNMGMGLGAAPYMTPLGLSRPDLRISHQSLAASQLGGFTPGMRASLSRAPSQRSDRRRPRPKSRERTSSRLSHAESTHSLTGYDTDGWTDHDMDIYMARNPTRGGLVQL